MNSLQSAMIGMTLLFWIPSIAYIIYKYTNIKHSETVIGKVIDIVPVYRGAKYTLEIHYNNAIETKTIMPNTAFQQYRIEQEIELYRYEKDGVTQYYVKGSNYTVPLVAMTVSFIFFIVSLGA